MGIQGNITIKHISNGYLVSFDIEVNERGEFKQFYFKTLSEVTAYILDIGKDWKECNY